MAGLFLQVLFVLFIVLQNNYSLLLVENLSKFLIHSGIGTFVGLKFKTKTIPWSLSVNCQAFIISLIS